MIYIKVRVLEVRISLFSNHTLKNNAQLSGRAAVGHTVTDLEAAHKKYILHRKTLIFLTKLCTRTTFSRLNIILILNVHSKKKLIRYTSWFLCAASKPPAVSYRFNNKPSHWFCKVLYNVHIAVLEHGRFNLDLWWLSGLYTHHRLTIQPTYRI